MGVAKPGLLRVEHGRVGAAALSEVMLLAREPGSSTQALADEELARAGIEPAGRWELGSSEAVKRSASAGLGAAFLSRYAVAEEVEAGRLESFRLAGRPPLERLLGRAPRRTAPLPGERAFIETLTRCCATNADYATACVG